VIILERNAAFVQLALEKSSNTGTWDSRNLQWSPSAERTQCVPSLSKVSVCAGQRGWASLYYDL
jgi:hypothetical protein